MDLLNHDIEVSTTFRCLPKFDSVVFAGFVNEKVQFFRAHREEEDFIILVLTVIRKEDKFVWESSRDLLDQAVSMAALKMSGVFQFDLLNFDLHREIQGFNPQELSQMLMNLGRKLAPGRQACLKYSSVYGLLRKLVVEDWGKIVFRSAVEVYHKTPEQLDLWVKKLCRIPVKEDGRRVVVINDLSQEPIFDKENQAQQERLTKDSGGQMNLFGEAPAFDVYINDRNGTQDLIFI